MRLIYGRDYYDNALALGGHDDPLVFVRHKEKTALYQDAYAAGIRIRTAHSVYIGTERELHRRYRNNNEFYTPKGVFGKLHYVNVVFCGTLYTGVCVTMDPFSASPKEHYFWTYGKITDFFTKNGVAEISPRRSKRFLQFYDDRPELNEIFTPIVLPETTRAWLIDHSITIMTYNKDLYDRTRQDHLWRVDGDDLKDVEFYKVFDSYSAFAEIEMWAGGVLSGAERPMVELSDEMKAAKHGYDKWSFRKPPQKGK